MRSRWTNGHARTPVALAELEAAWEMFLQFAQQAGGLSHQEQQQMLQRGERALDQLAAGQDCYQAVGDRALHFLALLRAALHGGRAHLVDRNGRRPNGSATYQRRTCPQDWWVNFLQPFFNTAPSWTVPSGVKYGVTVNAREMDNATQYALNFEGNVPTSAQMGLDMYNFDSTRQSEFSNTIKMFQGISPVGPIHSVFVEEFGGGLELSPGLGGR